MLSLGTAKTYLKIFSAIGIAGGTRAASKKLSYKITRSHPENEATQISVNGFDHPISLRLYTDDWSMMHQIFVDKDYKEPSPRHSEALEELYKRILSEGGTPVILDCGANIGLASVWYSARFPMARIVAIEPEPNNFALLRKNTSPYRNVTSINAAISNHRSRIDLSNARGSDATSAWETVESNSGPIEAITIRDALAQVPNATPFIAKIDIEGFETELFRSDYDWVGQFPLIVFEHHDWLFAWKGTAHAMFKALTEFGPRDYLQRGENIFSYSHALLMPSQA